MGAPDDRSATARTRARYQRIAPVYDAMESLVEWRYRPWRRELWARARGPRVLEVGVGTGKNMPFYPGDAAVIAVDLSPAMLARARRRAAASRPRVELRLGDAQALEFPDASFDTVVATFVFCSVPDPVAGLRELGRVVKPDGHVLLLEHVRAAAPGLGRLMDLLNPLVVRMVGANINRRTVENVRHAGLVVESVTDLGVGGIFKQIVARRGAHALSPLPH